MKRSASVSLLPQELVRSLRIGYKFVKASLHNFRDDTPVLIYAMPKSGTSTVEATLKSTELPVYKAHRLSERGLTLAEKKLDTYKSRRFFNIQKISRVIQHKVDKNPNVSWRLITLTREPIAQTISALFQGITYFHRSLIDESGEVKVDEAVQYLESNFALYAESILQSGKPDWYTLNWFENELAATFGIDVYEYPYDFGSGYTYIVERNINILVIRMEDLNRGFPSSAQKLLNLSEPPQIQRENTGESKKFYDAYKAVKNRVRVPKSVCEVIYSSKYAKHFYTAEEIESFIEKWSRA